MFSSFVINNYTNDGKNEKIEKHNVIKNNISFGTEELRNKEKKTGLMRFFFK
tara:strand:+ start:223 stop:378 length:156 start_codon:yes stop_codon:yes gene_type:complete